MKKEQIMKIFEDTAYVRMGGSAEELRAAEYLKAQCDALGFEAQIVPFEVDMATIQILICMQSIHQMRNILAYIQMAKCLKI